MKKWKRALGTFLVMTLMMGLCACSRDTGGKESGGKKPAGSQDVSLAKQYVYRLEEIDLSAAKIDGDDVYIQNVYEQDGRAYLLLQMYNWSMEGNSSRQKLLTMKTDGTDLKCTELKMSVGDDQAQDTDADRTGADAAKKKPDSDTAQEEEIDKTYEYTGVNNFLITKTKEMYGIKNYQMEDYSDPENYISISEIYLCCWDMDGNMKWEQPLKELLEPEEGPYYYVNALAGLEDGKIAIILSGEKSAKIVADTQGNLSKIQPFPELGDLFDRASNWKIMPDGKIRIIYYDQQWTNLYSATIDVEKGTLSEETQLPAELLYGGMSGINVDKNGDLLYTNARGLFRYHEGDAESAQIMSFVNSDLYISGLNAVLTIDDERFLGFYTTYDNAIQHSVLGGGVFTKVAPEDIPDKTVLVLGGRYIPYDLRKRVVDFNKSSDTHRFVLKEYNQYNTPDDYRADVKQLNNDIISGNMPDIMIVDNNLMSFENYVAKGVFADIGELIKKDEELSKTEYMENVFEACSINGKLYEIIPNFYVNTYVAKKSLVGDKQGWTMAQAQEFLATMPEGTSLLGDARREYFFHLAMEMCGRDFIDVSTGKCNFDSPEFIALMQFAKTLPSEQQNQNDIMYDDKWYMDMDYQSQYRENRTILGNCYLYEFTNLVNVINGSFGEDVAYIGFPTASGIGAVIYTGTTYALSVKCADMDKAWEFMRYYLTDEYQKMSVESMGQIPVTKKYFDEAAKKAMGKPYYLDVDGKKVEYEYNYWINNEQIVLEPLTQKQVDEAKAFVSSVNKRAYYNEDILNIITEEMDAFFQNQKSAADVAGIIQSRAKLFVNENR